MSLLPEANAMPLSRHVAKMGNALAGKRDGGRARHPSVAESAVRVVLRDFA